MENKKSAENQILYNQEKKYVCRNWEYWGRFYLLNSYLFATREFRLPQRNLKVIMTCDAFRNDTIIVMPFKNGIQKKNKTGLPNRVGQ